MFSNLSMVRFESPAVRPAEVAWIEALMDCIDTDRASEAKLDKRISDLYRLLTSCASPLSQEGMLLGALVESEDDKCKRALLQDTLLLIMLGDRHLCDPEALDDALFMVVADQKYDSLWRSRFHNSFCESRRAEHAAVEEQNENTLTEECEECGDRCWSKSALSNALYFQVYLVVTLLLKWWCCCLVVILCFQTCVDVAGGCTAALSLNC